jgi:hypothetical protein
VVFNPFDINNVLSAFQVSNTEVIGIATITTDIDIDAQFFLSSDVNSNLQIDLSLDGHSYDGVLDLSLVAFSSVQFYYRIQLNQGGLLTPIGNIPLGAGLQINGPVVFTPMELVYYPNDPPVFTVSVLSSIKALAPLSSSVRLAVGLTGNSIFDSDPILFTNLLTEDWTRENLTWQGFWSEETIKDLRVTLQAVALDLENDVPYVDVDTMELEIQPYCPGVYPPPELPPVPSFVILHPNADQTVLGWTPLPVFSRLVSPVYQVSSSYVSTDPRQPNQLILELDDLVGFPPAGVTRVYRAVDVLVHARSEADGSSTFQFLLSTNYGAPLPTGEIGPDLVVYKVRWEYPDGLTVAQINRMYVNIQTDILNASSDDCLAYIYSVEVWVEYMDTFVPVSPPPPVGMANPIVILNPTGQVYSCGSLGSCTGVTGDLLGRLTITNGTTLPLTVVFMSDGSLHLRVFDTNTPTTEYQLNMQVLASTTINFSVFAWVGDPTNPFPLESRSGEVVITASDGTTVYSGVIGWTYAGLE